MKLSNGLKLSKQKMHTAFQGGFPEQGVTEHRAAPRGALSRRCRVGETPAESFRHFLQSSTAKKVFLCCAAGLEEWLLLLLLFFFFSFPYLQVLAS